jgi:predicted dienelactone hydrolase
MNLATPRFILACLLASTAACSGGDDDAGNPGADDTSADSGSGDSSADSGSGDTSDDTSADSGSGDASDDSSADSGSGDTSDDVGQDTEPPLDIDRPLDWPVGGSGPFLAGYRRWERTYRGPGDEADRTIGINVWYPTTEANDEHPNYLGLGLFRDPDVYVDAPLAAPVHAGRFPVIVYSHGSQGQAGTASDLMRHFASHGWVAVAPDHTGNLFNDNLDPRPLAMYAWRPLDVSQALDALRELDASDPLSGKVSLDRVVMAGHSFGVYSTWGVAGATYDMAQVSSRCEAGEFADCTPERLAGFEAGFGDPRIIAAIPMGGSIGRDWFGASGHSTVTIPILAMSSSNETDQTRDQFETTAGIDMTWVDIAGGCHETFALGFCATFNRDRGYRVVNTYAMAFARHWLLDDSGETTLSILAGTTPVDEAVTLAHHD